jgi:pSer/pThr/pTyr-binding forkhead associated (FHA) protein
LDKITIGRATASATWEVALLDPAVSRPHARMERIDDIWHIFDLASANGTFVNHTRLAPDQRCALNDGDILQIGTTLLQFRSG